MDPINYVTPAPDFLTSISDGYKLGMGIQQLRAQRAEMEQKQAAAQAQQERQQAFRKEIGPAILAGDPGATATLFAKYPEFGDELKKATGFLSDADENNIKTTTATVFNGLESGDLNIAKQALQSRVDYRNKIGAPADVWKSALDNLNSGDPTKIAQVKQQATLMHALYNPTAVKAINDIHTDQRAQEVQPAKVREAGASADKAVADASTAATTAKYAESKALTDLEKSGWDIKAIQADIGFKRESNRIAAMNAAANRENNSLKRQELQIKVNEARSALDTRVRENAAAAESGAASIDNMTNTINRVLDSPGLDKVVGSVQGRLGSYLSDEGADSIALIDTLGSQAFLSQIAAVKGMGSLSNAEGEKLQAAFQNFSRTQSEGQFKANLKEGLRLLTKARKNTEQKFGVPLSAPDAPAAARNQAGKGGATSTQKNITVDF